jgi:membrane-associated PAP2 superfamily phosphatase
MVIDWLLPLAILTALTVYLRAGDVDVRLERAFHDDALGWRFANDQPWSALYHYGPVPAWIVAAGSLLLLSASRWRPALSAYRRVFLYLVVVMVVGPGLIVNTTFKEHWGRPRPMDLREFGGGYDFVRVWDKGDPERGQSFPSGHASTGFYFFALYFALRSRRPRHACVWFVVALVFGAIIGVARMVQGKHFLSDVVWSAGFVYLTAAALDRALLGPPGRPTAAQAQRAPSTSARSSSSRPAVSSGTVTPLDAE